MRSRAHAPGIGWPRGVCLGTSVPGIVLPWKSKVEAAYHLGLEDGCGFIQERGQRQVS